MKVRQITLGVMVALTATALAVVIAANPFSARASSVVGTEAPVVESLQQTDSASTTYIGIALLPVSDAEAEQLGIDGGAKVHRVDENGPSGGVLEVGDVITIVNGDPVATPGDVAGAVQATGVGDTLVLTVIRDGVTIDNLSVTVGERQVTRHVFRKSRAPRTPDLTQMLLGQAQALGDRFARGQMVIADADGNYQTYSAAIGIITESDPDAGTFTLQPRDGSDPVDYAISDDTKVRLARDGDIGALNLTDTTLVIDVDGEVKLVHQGPLPASKINQRQRFGKRGHLGQSRFQGRAGRGPGIGSLPAGTFKGGAFGFRNGTAGFDPSSILEELRQRLGERRADGSGSSFRSLICDSEHLDDLPDGIVIRCETQTGSGTAPTVGDDAV
jgi:hypothetical protein